MNNFESVTSNIDAFIEFARNNEWEINCENCLESPGECSGDCSGNLIEFLKLEKEIKTDNSVDAKEFSKFYSKLKSSSNLSVVEYTDVNYSINVFESWKKNDLSLTNNQKQAILSLKESYLEKMENLKRLGRIFDSLEAE